MRPGVTAPADERELDRPQIAPRGHWYDRLRPLRTTFVARIDTETNATATGTSEELDNQRHQHQRQADAGHALHKSAEREHDEERGQSEAAGRPSTACITIGLLPAPKVITSSDPSGGLRTWRRGRFGPCPARLRNEEASRRAPNIFNLSASYSLRAGRVAPSEALPNAGLHAVRKFFVAATRAQHVGLRVVWARPFWKCPPLGCT